MFNARSGYPVARAYSNDESVSPVNKGCLTLPSLRDT